MKKKAAEKAEAKKKQTNKLGSVEAAKLAVKQREKQNKPKAKIVDLWKANWYYVQRIIKLYY